MKVQITVDEALWRKAKVSAMLRGQSLGELVGVALGDLLKNVLMSDGLAAFEEFQKTPVKPLGKERKQPSPKTPTTIAPAKQSKAIGGVPVGPLVEPEFVCKACGKPTDGSFLCPFCKKA